MMKFMNPLGLMMITFMPYLLSLMFYDHYSQSRYDNGGNKQNKPRGAEARKGYSKPKGHSVTSPVTVISAPAVTIFFAEHKNQQSLLDV